MTVEFKEPVSVEEKISKEEKYALVEAIVEGLFNVRERKKDGSVVLYGQGEDVVNIPREAISQYIHYKASIKAISEDGKEFDKELSIYQRAEEERVIISFGGFATYELDLFLEDYNKNEIKNLCIDAGGRNHGTDSVWVMKEDIIKALDSYTDKHEKERKEARKVTDMIEGELIVKGTHIFPAPKSFHKVNSKEIELNGEESIAESRNKVPCTVLLDKEDGVKGFVLDSGNVIKASGDDDFNTYGEKKPIDHKIVSLLEESEEDIPVLMKTGQ